MSTSWVEVSQQCTIPLLIFLSLLLQIVSLRIDMISDDIFNCALGASVWVCGSNWAMFWDRNHVWNSSRITIDGGGRREDDIGDVIFAHASQKRDCAANVDAIVFEWDFGRFSNCLSHKSWLV